MRRFLIILMICLGTAVVIFLLVSRPHEDKSGPGETETSAFHPSEESAQKEIVVESESQTEQEQLADNELSDEELKYILDWLDGLSADGEETQQSESQEEASPYEEIETNAEEDWEDKVRAAYKEALKALIAVRDAPGMALIRREKGDIKLRMIEIADRGVKVTRAELEEFDYLQARSRELSPIREENKRERDRIREEFETEYGMTWNEADMLTYPEKYEKAR